MDAKDAEVVRWSGNPTVNEAVIRDLMAREGLDAYRWSNRPGDRYSPHTHGYNKVIYVVDGSITFTLPATGRREKLFAGDRLNLRAGVSHGAIVGPDGVKCLEAHR